jgi:hypothetical protein
MKKEITFIEKIFELKTLTLENSLERVLNMVKNYKAKDKKNYNLNKNLLKTVTSIS